MRVAPLHVAQIHIWGKNPPLYIVIYYINKVKYSLL